jgi:hypothetical protein
MEEWEEWLSRPLSATDQPPGTYRYRSGRRCPWQPVRIIYDGYNWHVLLRGEPVKGSGQADPHDIPFVRFRAPFHPITMREYHDLLDDYRDAKPGSPLLTPDEPVNLRGAPPV